jgi:hypothetical protein
MIRILWALFRVYNTSLTNSYFERNMKMIIRSMMVVLMLLIAYPASAEVDWEQAEQIVKNLPCSKGGTVDEFLNSKATIPAVEDLGWMVYPRDYGFEAERLMLLNGTMRLSYKWSVDKHTGAAKPINGKAIEITR